MSNTENQLKQLDARLQPNSKKPVLFAIQDDEDGPDYFVSLAQLQASPRCKRYPDTRPGHSGQVPFTREQLADLENDYDLKVIQLFYADGPDAPGMQK